MNIEELHRLVWNRYIRMPYCHLLDAADADGNAHIPTVQECEQNIPTVMGWTTSIADCAFFGGLYLYGLCEKYDTAPTENLADEILRLADGLLMLCEIAKRDGFIARGVADDGVTHYPSGSTDQVGPWALGLWRLMRSPVADAALLARIRACMARTLRGLMEANWRVPTEWADVTKGSFADADWRGVSKLMLLATIARELGMLSPEEHEALANEKPKKSIYTRLEIISHGVGPDMVRNNSLIQFWICTCAQISLRELLTYDAPRADWYRQGLLANAAVVVPHLREFTVYEATEPKNFDHNWRQLIPEMRPWETTAEAYAEASRLNRVWPEKFNPLRNVERKTLGQAFFGAWMAIASGDQSAADYARACLLEAMETVSWDKVGHSFAFVVEAALACDESWNR